MKARKVIAMLMISTLSALSFSALANPLKAEAQTPKVEDTCGKSVAGTYLITIKDSTGKFASRQLITLTRDGNVIIGDSNQGGISGVFNPFTAAQGTYQCVGQTKIRARALDFALPGGIARDDYQATFNLTTKTVTGTIALSFFGLTDNPLGSGTVAGTFTFEGQFIKL